MGTKFLKAKGEKYAWRVSDLRPVDSGFEFFRVNKDGDIDTERSFVAASEVAYIRPE